MNSNELKAVLAQNAFTLPNTILLGVNNHETTEVCFERLEDAFFRPDASVWLADPRCSMLLEKPHALIPGIRSIQAALSVDALTAMIFCHPQTNFTAHVAEWFGGDNREVTFKVPAPLRRINGRSDPTQIDLAVNNCFVLARLAESSLHSGEMAYVDQYALLRDSFDVSKLPVLCRRYSNFAALRGILASIQYDKKHVFLCDRRRTDLVDAYSATVACLKREVHRQRCRVVYWQELISSCSLQLSRYLAARYSL